MSADSWSSKFESFGVYSINSAYLSLIGEVQRVMVRPVAHIRVLASLGNLGRLL
ncbi:hypothetical protein A2U01_0059218, partial [Trifolium medium]|nr:hypothetical protein [Trifolium medium]